MRTLHPSSNSIVHCATLHNAPAAHPIFSSGFIARFWAKVDRRGDNECWPWQASSGGPGYGHIWAMIDDERVCLDAHKAAWIIENGRMPVGNVTHDCNSKPCCNPAHLADK